MTSIRVPSNFGGVRGWRDVYRSANPAGMSKSQRARLARRLELRTVVCAAAELSDPGWPAAVTWVHLPIAKPILTPRQWRIWLALLRHRTPLLVHCHAGAERTGILAAHAEVFAGVSLGDAERALHRHGLGYWEGPEYLDDLRALRASLESLQVAGDVPGTRFGRRVLERKRALMGSRAPDESEQRGLTVPRRGR